MLSASIACFAAFTAPNWSIGPNLQFQWGGNDYLPIGVQTDYSPSVIAQIKAAGIRDVNVEVPLSTSWKAIGEELSGTNYFLTLNAAMPAATGFIVQPQHYRVANIKNPTTISISLPGASRAFVAVALRRDMTVISQGTFNVQNGILKANLKALQDSEQVVLIYPQAESLEMEDLWEKLDERRDQVLKQIRQMGPQAGLKGIINPLGTTPYLPSQDLGFVPTSPTFQREFADFLEQKYRNLNTLVKAWQMRAFDLEVKEDEQALVQDRNAFTIASRLVPLWNGQKGLPMLLDPAREAPYAVETKRSLFWKDLAACISQVRARRVHRIIRALRKESSVPILQEWNGWSWFFEAPECEFSGLTTRLPKLNPATVTSVLALPLSSSLRTRNAVPIIVTDVPVPAEGASQNTLDSLASMGVRGAFFRASTADQLAKVKALGSFAATSRPSAFFYPINATNPAQPRLLGGSTWSLPSPADGRRIDLGPDLQCYSIVQNGITQYVMWNDKTPGVINFRFPDYKTALIRSMGGIAPTLTVIKGIVQIPVDSIPMIVTGASGPPVPESELLKVTKDIGQIAQWAESARKDISTELYEFRPYEEMVKTNPFDALQLAQRTYKRISVIAVGANWQEWESSSDNLFSEVIRDAGCSNGAYLSLRTPLGEVTGSVYALLPVQQRTSAPLDVWVAARIPNPQDRARLKFKISGQNLAIRGEPVSIYGTGFGWYNLGTTRLPASRTEIRAEISGISSTEIALDALCLTPQTFQPDNTRLPAWTLPEPTPPPGKGSGGR